MASAEREPITGVYMEAELAPSRVHGKAFGQESGAKPPEAKSIEAFVHLMEGPKLCCHYAKTV